jgi:hypothetical protein
VVEVLEDRQLLDAGVLLPGDLTPAPAVGRQESPQIARGDNGYLAVWTDLRTALRPPLGVFGGPYSGPGLGSMMDIYGARLDVNGRLLYTTPIIISQAPYNQASPRVGWNGQNWLVAWVTERENDRNFSDVMAARVAPDGTVLDRTPILVNAAQTTINYFPPWSVASDGPNWVVVYRDLDSAAGIFTIDAKRISPDGVVLDPVGKRLRRDFWNSGATNADIARAGDEYLLTWIEIPLDAGGNHWILKGQRLTLDLNPIGSLFTVNVYGLTERSEPRAPRVASDGDGFFVTWFEDRFFGFAQVFGTRVSHAGQVLDPNGIPITGFSDYSQFTPAPAWDGTNWVVAYNKSQPFPNLEDIYATRISPTGVVLDPDGILVKGGPASQNQPAIAPGATGGAQVVWTDFQAGGVDPQDIYTAAVSADGTVTPDAPISLGAPRQSQPRMAAGNDGFLVVFPSEVSGETRILAERLDAAGNPLDGEPLRLAGGSPSLRNPSVAWNGSEYLVVWENAGEGRGQVYGRRVLPDGTVLDSTPLAIMQGNTPDVAALGDTFLVVASFAQTPQLRFTESVRVSTDGVVLGAPTRLGFNFDVSPRVAAFADRWLVVWERHPTHDNPRAVIVGAFVQPDGTSPGPFNVSGGAFDYTPHLAVAGDSALIVWAAPRITGRRIGADGSFLGSAFALSTAPAPQSIPAVAWDGTQYLVAWLDHRNELFPKQPRGDIYGTRVDGDGNVLDPDGIAIASSPLPEETPTVATLNGLGIFAYAAFVDQAPYAALRITLQTLGSGSPGGAAVGNAFNVNEAALAAILDERNSVPRNDAEQSVSFGNLADRSNQDRDIVQAEGATGTPFQAVPRLPLTTAARMERFFTDWEGSVQDNLGILL